MTDWTRYSCRAQISLLFFLILLIMFSLLLVGLNADARRARRARVCSACVSRAKDAFAPGGMIHYSKNFWSLVRGADDTHPSLQRARRIFLFFSFCFLLLVPSVVRQHIMMPRASSRLTCRRPML